MIDIAPTPNRLGAKLLPALREEAVLIAKELKRVLSEEKEKTEVVPWWMGLSTIKRAKAMAQEIEGSLSSFSAENRHFREAFRRLGFAGHGD